MLDPVAFYIGGSPIYWYTLMYALSFFIAWKMLNILFDEELKMKNKTIKNLDENTIAYLIIAMVFGVIVGGRVGYALFYNFDYYLINPIQILQIKHGGMSFHGGFLGVLITGFAICKLNQIHFLTIADKVAIVAPIGLALGRLGNFINGELWGRATEVPWAMKFISGGDVYRHPSQLYEMILEGIVLFALLWATRKRKWPTGMRIGLFAIGYSLTRMFCEQFREPDAHIGFIFSIFTEGMLLSLPMLIVGCLWVAWLYKVSHKKVSNKIKDNLE